MLRFGNKKNGAPFPLSMRRRLHVTVRKNKYMVHLFRSMCRWLHTTVRKKQYGAPSPYSMCRRLHVSVPKNLRAYAYIANPCQRPLGVDLPVAGRRLACSPPPADSPPPLPQKARSTRVRTYTRNRAPADKKTRRWTREKKEGKEARKTFQRTRTEQWSAQRFRHSGLRTAVCAQRCLQRLKTRASAVRSRISPFGDSGFFSITRCASESAPFLVDPAAFRSVLRIDDKHKSKTETKDARTDMSRAKSKTTSSRARAFPPAPDTSRTKRTHGPPAPCPPVTLHIVSHFARRQLRHEGG